MNDFNLDLDGLELEDNDSALELAVDAVESALGLEGMDFSDAEDNLGFDVDDGSNITLDFGGEEEELDAATLLRTETDVSKTLLDYANYVTNARQKILAVSAPVTMKRTLPPFSEFSFISNPRERQMVYGFFCSMLEDLTTEERYLNLTAEQAYQTLLSEMFNEIHYTPNVHAVKFEHIFMSLYERNKRLSRVQLGATVPTLGSLIDSKKLDQAELVYTVNSVPFNWVTRFFDDTSIIPLREKINVSEYGELCVLIKKDVGNRTVYFSDVLRFIGSFLTSPETLKILQLTADQSLEFTTGELLRRYVLQELNSGDFFPIGMAKLVDTKFSDALLYQVYQSLITATQRQSFAAEMLVLILQMMHSSAMMHGGDASYRDGYTVSLARFLSAFIEDKALVNPVFYSYIGYVEDGGERAFDLGYADGEQSLMVRTDGILCEIIGDNSNIYHIPLVYVDNNTKGVICPPPEVLEGVRKLAPSGKISVGGEICYRCDPTFAWLATLNLASSAGPQADDTIDEGIGHSNNPLLDVLLHYTNKFDTSGEHPKAVSVNAPGHCSLMGIQFSGSDSIHICRLLNSSGRQLQIENGICLSDNGELIVRYIDKSQMGEQVLVLSDGEYESASLATGQGDVGMELPSLSSLLSWGKATNDEVMSAVFSGDYDAYQKSVAQRICSLNALDYDSILSSAQEVVMRDLAHVIDVNSLDRMLGVKLLEHYLEKFPNGVLDSFNLHTLRELCAFVLGEPNVLSEQFSITPGVWSALRDEVQTLSTSECTVLSQVKNLASLDLHTLAIQICSRSELHQDVDRDLYFALHYIPEMHRLLSSLENQMVLIKALREIGDDIAPVLRKSSPAFSCYNTVTTRDSVTRVEANLKSGMRDREAPPALSATRKVLEANIADDYAILKYFILERNLYGVLTELEECTTRGDEKYKELYTTLRDKLQVELPETVQSITEPEFHALVTSAQAEAVFIDVADEALKLVLDGLISEASMNIDLQVLKAYDIFTVYGKHIFNLAEDAKQDFSDCDAFRQAFYSYAGSFLLTYCPVIGEAADEVDGGFDRYSAYVRNRKDYEAGVNLQSFEAFRLRDLKLVTGLETEETLAAQSGKDDVDPAEL